MPKLQRWIVASKMVEVLDRETVGEIGAMGGQIGGGWCEVHQHICVNMDNKERIENLLVSKGYVISLPSDRHVSHPECHVSHHELEEQAT